MKLNIALCHFRVGETDGVSLEMDKWKVVLEKLGHNVQFIAGSKGTLNNVEIIDELHYNDANNNKIVENAYTKFHQFTSEQDLKNTIEKDAKAIENKLINIISKNDIDIIIVNNIFSLGWNLSAGIGFYNAVKNSSVNCICHHHDFYWEREKYSNPTLPFIKNYLSTYFPPKHNRIKHVVINSIAKKELLKRKNIQSTVVPNVFDFDVNWITDDYNEDFRASLNLKQNDLVILQATRIVKRKGIELALDFVAELNKNKHQLIGKKLYNNQYFDNESNIVFLMVGLNEDSPYYNKLLNYANEKNVTVVLANDKVNHARSFENNLKKYSLWDAYTQCDIVTYTSLLEGWGNQFIEALVAKKIIVNYQYPVYEKDILPLNFKTIDLGNKHSIKNNGLTLVDENITSNAVNEALALILNEKAYSQNVTSNFTIGKKNLSLSALETLLKLIVENEA